MNTTSKSKFDQTRLTKATGGSVQRKKSRRAGGTWRGICVIAYHSRSVARPYMPKRLGLLKELKFELTRVLKLRSSRVDVPRQSTPEM